MSEILAEQIPSNRPEVIKLIRFHCTFCWNMCDLILDDPAGRFTNVQRALQPTYSWSIQQGTFKALDYKDEQMSLKLQKRSSTESNLRDLSINTKRKKDDNPKVTILSSSRSKLSKAWPNIINLNTTAVNDFFVINSLYSGLFSRTKLKMAWNKVHNMVYWLLLWYFNGACLSCWSFDNPRLFSENVPCDSYKKERQDVNDTRISIFR